MAIFLSYNFFNWKIFGSLFHLFKLDWYQSLSSNISNFHHTCFGAFISYQSKTSLRYSRFWIYVNVLMCIDYLTNHYSNHSQHFQLRIF